jgi:hypothetical protein
MGILFASEYLYRTFFIKKKTDFAISIWPPPRLYSNY